VTGWLLDTNVLSELRRPKPDRKVVAFIAAQPLELLYVSAVTLTVTCCGPSLRTRRTSSLKRALASCKSQWPGCRLPRTWRRGFGCFVSFDFAVLVMLTRLAHLPATFQALRFRCALVGDQGLVSDARFMMLESAPMEGPRFIWWNFVSSRTDRIEQAKADWKLARFDSVPGDPEFIPLPEGEPKPVTYL